MITRSANTSPAVHGLQEVNPQQCGLAHAGRPDNGDESRRGFIGKPVDEGDMEALLFDLTDDVLAYYP